MSKIWIYQYGKGFRFVDKDRCYSHVHCPPNRIRFITRRKANGDHDFEYVHHGATKRECWLRATEHERREIRQREEQVAALKKRMDDKYGPEPKEDDK